MKTLLLLSVLLTGTMSYASETCKVNLFADKGWFPAEIKAAIEAKNYEFVSRNDYAESEIDFYVSYVPMSAGLYRGSRGKTKRFVYFDMKRPGARESLIFTQVGSKKSDFASLMKAVDKKALVQIRKKLPTCNR